MGIGTKILNWMAWFTFHVALVVVSTLVFSLQVIMLAFNAIVPGNVIGKMMDKMMDDIMKKYHDEFPEKGE